GYSLTVKVWDAATGEERLTLAGHSNWVNSVAWNPDSTRLASASEDRTVKIWDAATGKVCLTLKGHTSQVDFVAWSRDGTRLAAACANHTIWYWDASPSYKREGLSGPLDSKRQPRTKPAAPAVGRPGEE